MKKPEVICVHIGARAHYLLPVALQSGGYLKALITDTWVANARLRRLLAMIPFSMFRSLAGRYHEHVPSASIYSFGLMFLFKDLWLRLTLPYGWKLVMKRDAWFEQEAVKKVKQIPQATALMGISYTALASFKEAKARGLKTILFQVDPGLEEENIVASIRTGHNQKTSWERAPKEYWEHWKEECALADTIMVNSEWSKTGLIAQGISADVIHIIALPFALKEQHTEFVRTYPSGFTRERPLRCLFLGTLALRKGIHLVLQAAKALQDYPIEFILVGRPEIPEEEMHLPNIRYKGLVTREETDVYYQQADVFLFPTLSDGFGLTQLEAMAWQLPVIATDRCGDVVMENHNGWRIDPSDASDLITLLKHITLQPAGVQQRSVHCLDTVREYSTTRFAEEITALL